MSQFLEDDIGILTADPVEEQKPVVAKDNALGLEDDLGIFKDNSSNLEDDISILHDTYEPQKPKNFILEGLKNTFVGDTGIAGTVKHAVDHVRSLGLDRKLYNQNLTNERSDIEQMPADLRKTVYGTDDVETAFKKQKENTDRAVAFGTSSLDKLLFNLPSMVGKKTGFDTGLSKEIQDKQKISTEAGGAMGDLGSLITTGTALNATKLPGIAVKAGEKGVKYWKASTRFLPRAIMTSAIFATDTVLKKTIEQARDDKFDPVELAQETIEAGGLGGLIGAVGGVVNVPMAVISATGIGTAYAKLKGADNLDAALNGTVFGLFELIGGYGRDARLREETLGYIRNSMADWAVKKNPGMAPAEATKAADIFMGETVQAAGGVDKVLSSKENTVSYLEEVNKRIQDAIAKPEIKPGVKEPAKIEGPAPEPKPPAETQPEPISQGKQGIVDADIKNLINTNMLKEMTPKDVSEIEPFGPPSEGLGKKIAEKLGIKYEQIKLLGYAGKDIEVRRDARKILRILSDRVEDDFKLQKLSEFKPESDFFKKAISTPTEGKVTAEFANSELSSLKDLGHKIELVGSVKTKGVSNKDMDVLVRLPKYPESEVVFKKFEADLKKQGWEYKFSDENNEKGWGVFHHYEKSGKGMDVFIDELPTPTEGKVAEEEIKIVSENILKNNTGITRSDAEAMARDVIENRKLNKPTGGKVEPSGVEVVSTETLNKFIEEGKKPAGKFTVESSRDTADGEEAFVVRDPEGKLQFISSEKENAEKKAAEWNKELFQGPTVQSERKKLEKSIGKLKDHTKKQISSLVESGTSQAEAESLVNKSPGGKSLKHMEEQLEESRIVNPINSALPQEMKVEALKELSQENEPLIAAIVKELKEDLGLFSKYSFKKDENIIKKANRPEIKKIKPWFDVEHIRDAIRFKTQFNNFDDIQKIYDLVKSKGWGIVKADFRKMFEPRLWGWRFAAFDLRMPNGQLVEYYFMPKELDESAVKDANHDLFNFWRDKTDEYKDAHRKEYRRDIELSMERYNKAWESFLKRTGQTPSAALASFKSVVDNIESETGTKLSLASSAEIISLRQEPFESRTAEKSSVNTQARSLSLSSPTNIESPNLSVKSIQPDAGAVNENKELIKEMVEYFSQTGSIIKDSRELRELARVVFGGDPKTYYDELYDAIEMGLNRQYRVDFNLYSGLGNKMQAALKAEESLPLRSRSLETIKLQQFSTPLTLATAANHLLDPQSGDIILEPTAGTGNLIVPFWNGNQRVIANELDERRLEVLKHSGFTIEIYDQDFLKYNGPAPTVIISNPPFGALSKGKYVGFAADFEPSNIDQRFIAKMLRLLPDGGRIAVITSQGTGNGISGSSFRKWLEKEHTFMASIASPEGSYKYRGSPQIGTSLLMIEKGKGRGEVKPLIKESVSGWDEYIKIIDDLRTKYPRLNILTKTGESGTLKSGGKSNVSVSTTPSAVRKPAGQPAELSSRGGEPGRGGQPAIESGERPAVIPPQQLESRTGVEDDVGQGTPAVGAGIQQRPAAGTQNRKRIGSFVQYQRHNTLPVVNPHPSVIVESQELASVNPPVITYQPSKRLLDTYKEKNISDQAMDVVLQALQSVSKGKGFLIADDVGVGKTREMAAIALDALDTGKANRVLYVTVSKEVLNVHLAGDFSTVMTGKEGNPLPFPTVRLEGFPNLSKQENLPVENKAVYTITRDLLKKHHERILQIGFDLVIFDEAHQWRPANEKQAKAIAWKRIHTAMAGKPMIYATATPGMDLSSLDYLYGLGEWTEGTFDQYIANITGEQVQRRGMFAGGSSFASSGSIPLTQQFMREMKMKGLYSSRDLSRQNVKFSARKVEFTPEDIKAYNEYTNFLLRAYQVGVKYSRFNKVSGKKGLGLIKAMMQNAAKRHQVDLKIERIIPDIKKDIADGKRVFLFTSGLNELDEEAPKGYVRAVINAINEDQVESIEGEIFSDKIPESIEEKEKLLDEMNDLPAQLSIEKYVKSKLGAGYKVGYYTGNTTNSQKKKYLKEWMQGKIDIMLGSDAAKTAISAHDIIGKEIVNYYLDVDFEVTKFKQALGRTNRAGEKTSPSIIIPNIGAAGEQKFIATIASRMKSLGATSKGQAESGVVDFLSEFDLDGAIAHQAARDTFSGLDDSDKELFLNENLWETSPGGERRGRRVAPKGYYVDNFLYDLNFMPYEDGNRMFEKLIENYKHIIETSGELAALRAERLEGKQIKEMEIYRNPDNPNDYVVLHEVLDKSGHRFGIVSGMLLDKSKVFLKHGVSHFVRFQTPDNILSGKKVLPSNISALAKEFGKNVASSITVDNAFETIMAGDKVTLINDLSLYKRKDGNIGIKNAKMADKINLQKAGAKFSSVGSAWAINPTEEAVRAFIKYYPLSQGVKGPITPIGEIPEPPRSSLAESESGGIDIGSGGRTTTGEANTPDSSKVNEIGNVIKYYLGTKEERWASLLGKEKGRQVFEMIRFFDRAVQLVRAETEKRNRVIFAGIKPRIRAYIFDVLKGIHSIDDNGIIRFGALQPAGIVSGDEYAGLEGSALKDGRIIGEELEEGSGDYMTYRMYDTREEYTKLVEKFPRARQIIEKYLANEEAVKQTILGTDIPAFSRNVFKRQYNIQSRQPEGFSYLPSVRKELRLIARIKNIFRSYTPGGRKFKTGALAEAGMEEKDLLKAYTIRQGEFTYEELFNDMAGNIMALVLEPIENRKIKPGYVKVNINHPRIAKITEAKKELFKANGIDPDNLSLFQYPAAIEEEFNIQGVQKFHRPELQTAYQAIGKTYNSLIRGITTNYLVRPSTANRNFVSGFIQYNLRTLTNFYRGIMGKGFTAPTEDIKALYLALRPSMIRAIPAEVLGAAFQTEIAKSKTPFGYALAPFRAIEYYFKRASFLSDLNTIAQKRFREQLKSGKVKRSEFRNFMLDFKENYFADLFQLMSDNADSVTFDYWNKPYILEKLARFGKGLIPFPNYIYHKFRMYGEYSPLALRGMNKSNAIDKISKALAGLTMWMLAWMLANKSVKEREKQLNELAYNRMDFKFDTTGRIKFYADDNVERWLRVYDWPILGDMMYWREIKQGSADFGDWASDALSLGPVLQVPLILMGLRNKYQHGRTTESLVGEQVSGYVPFGAYLRYARVLQDPIMRKTYSNDYSAFENFINPIANTIPGLSSNIPERVARTGVEKGKIRKYDIPSETMKLFFLNVKSIDSQEYMNYVNEQIESGKVQKRIEKAARAEEKAKSTQGD